MVMVKIIILIVNVVNFEPVCYIKTVRACMFAQIRVCMHSSDGACIASCACAA